MKAGEGGYESQEVRLVLQTMDTVLFSILTLFCFCSQDLALLQHSRIGGLFMVHTCLPVLHIYSCFISLIPRSQRIGMAWE